MKSLLLLAAAVAYVHNWTDEHGVSHLKQCSFTNFTYTSFLPNSPPFYVDRPLPDTPARFQLNVLPAGWSGQWHRDPVVQLVYITSGTMNWTTMDGTSHIFQGSGLYLGNDQLSTRGHLSSCISEVPCTLSFVQFPSLDPKQFVGRPCFLR